MLNAKAHTPTGKVRPSVMAFSRQGMPNLPGTSKEGCLKGGYIVHGGDAKPDVILLATGACLFRLTFDACTLLSTSGRCSLCSLSSGSPVWTLLLEAISGLSREPVTSHSGDDSLT